MIERPHHTLALSRRATAISHSNLNPHSPTLTPPPSDTVRSRETIDAMREAYEAFRAVRVSYLSILYVAAAMDGETKRNLRVWDPSPLVPRRPAVATLLPLLTYSAPLCSFLCFLSFPSLFTGADSHCVGGGRRR